MAIIALLVIGSSLRADELLLKDGKTIEWRVLKDNGDTVDVQTADNKTITIKKQDIKEIRTVVPVAPLTGATFSGDTTKPADKPTNVLAMIDPKKHGTVGTWKALGGALMGGGLCDIPYIPTAYYDVEIVLERREGEDECTIGLIGAGKPFGVNLDWARALAAVSALLTAVGSTRMKPKWMGSSSPIESPAPLPAPSGRTKSSCSRMARSSSIGRETPNTSRIRIGPTRIKIYSS